MTVRRSTRQAWRALASRLTPTDMVALAGFALFAVAFATLLAVGVDVT